MAEVRRGSCNCYVFLSAYFPCALLAPSADWLAKYFLRRRKPDICTGWKLPLFSAQKRAASVVMRILVYKLLLAVFLSFHVSNGAEFLERTSWNIAKQSCSHRFLTLHSSDFSWLFRTGFECCPLWGFLFLVCFVSMIKKKKNLGHVCLSWTAYPWHSPKLFASVSLPACVPCGWPIVSFACPLHHLRRWKGASRPLMEAGDLRK